jgi:hypothetical protein
MEDHTAPEAGHSLEPQRERERVLQEVAAATQDAIRAYTRASAVTGGLIQVAGGALVVVALVAQLTTVASLAHSDFIAVFAGGIALILFGPRAARVDKAALGQATEDAAKRGTERALHDAQEEKARLDAERKQTAGSTD